MTKLKHSTAEARHSAPPSIQGEALGSTIYEALVGPGAPAEPSIEDLREFLSHTKGMLDELGIVNEEFQSEILTEAARVYVAGIVNVEVSRALQNTLRMPEVPLRLSFSAAARSGLRLGG